MRTHVLHARPSDELKTTWVKARRVVRGGKQTSQCVSWRSFLAESASVMKSLPKPRAITDMAVNGVALKRENSGPAAKRRATVRWRDTRSSPMRRQKAQLTRRRCWPTLSPKILWRRLRLGFRGADRCASSTRRLGMASCSSVYCMPWKDAARAQSNYMVSSQTNAHWREPSREYSIARRMLRLNFRLKIFLILSLTGLAPMGSGHFSMRVVTKLTTLSLQIRRTCGPR